MQVQSLAELVSLAERAGILSDPPDRLRISSTEIVVPLSYRTMGITCRRVYESSVTR